MRKEDFFLRSVILHGVSTLDCLVYSALMCLNGLQLHTELACFWWYNTKKHALFLALELLGFLVFLRQIKLCCVSRYFFPFHSVSSWLICIG